MVVIIILQKYGKLLRFNHYFIFVSRQDVIYFDSFHSLFFDNTSFLLQTEKFIIGYDLVQVKNSLNSWVKFFYLFF